MSILPQIVVNSLIAGSLYSLVAVSFNLVYGTTRFFNLTHGVMAAIGGYTVFFGLKTLEIPAIAAVLLGMLIAGLMGVLADRFVYLPLRRRKASPMILLVASLGLFTALQAIIAIIFTSQFQTLSSFDKDAHIYRVLGGVMTEVQVITMVLAFVTTFGLWVLLKYTLFGKAVKAISDDEEVAKIVGINTNRVISWVFFIGSALAGLAGIMIGFDTGLQPAMGMALLLKGVIGSIIGGIGSIWGGFLGAFLLGFVENFGIWKISGEWKDAIAFGLLIVFLLFRPQGILKK